MQATQLPLSAAPPMTRATITIRGADGVQQTLATPMNRQEVAALRLRRSEMSDQLVSAANRRHELSEEIKSAPAGASRTGLEQRIEVLDKRIMQIESDIASTGQQLSAAPLNVSAGTDGRGGGRELSRNSAPTAFVILVLFPLAIVFARNLWKRGTISAVAAPQQLGGEAGQRLERLEQGMDAIAIEIERVSEGQRFVTRLLSEGQPVREEARSHTSS